MTSLDIQQFILYTWCYDNSTRQEQEHVSLGAPNLSSFVNAANVATSDKTALIRPRLFKMDATAMDDRV